MWSGWNYCKCRWILLLCAAGCSQENCAGGCQARCNPQHDLRRQRQQAADQLIHQDGKGLIINDKVVEFKILLSEIRKKKRVLSESVTSAIRIYDCWIGFIVSIQTELLRMDRLFADFLFMTAWSDLSRYVRLGTFYLIIYVRLGTFSFEHFSQPPNLVQYQNRREKIAIPSFGISFAEICFARPVACSNLCISSWSIRTNPTPNKGLKQTRPKPWLNSRSKTPPSPQLKLYMYRIMAQ